MMKNLRRPQMTNREKNKQTMKRIIDIPEEDYNFLIEHKNEYNYERTRIAPILNSTPLTEVEAEDCISRKQAIKDFCLKTCDIPNCRFRDNGVVHASCDEVDVLKRVPSVHPKSDKPSGKWIDKQHLFSSCSAKCSVCEKSAKGIVHDNGYSLSYRYYDYCPNCGAKMVEPQESEAADDTEQAEE